MKKILLTGGKFALVDDEDYEYLNQWKWYCNNGYAVRDDKKQKRVYMHRVIIDTPDEKHTDHINMDRLDNRKENLRICTRSQNGSNRVANSNNTTGYKGVTKFRNLYGAYIHKDNKQIFLKYHKTPEEAARAYDEAAKRYHGKFAKLNFPDE